jgi:hypothetical protein
VRLFRTRSGEGKDNQPSGEGERREINYRADRQTDGQTEQERRDHKHTYRLWLGEIGKIATYHAKLIEWRIRRNRAVMQQ